MCQFCGISGHVARQCSKIQYSANAANAAFTPPHSNNSNQWLMDSGASLLISIHSEYNGTDEVQIADGSGLPISHIGNTTISHTSRNILLSNILCAPWAHRNLLSVHEFTKTNKVFIEFHPYNFDVKDQES